ncbi:MAG: AI-2E family transporter [Alphaproteobacteria bacterium]
MTAKEQLRFWLITGGVFILLVWLFSPILLPFVAGLAIAYFLNPVVSILHRNGLSRGVGASLVLLGFIIIVVLVLLLIVPLVQSQVAALIESVPGYAEKLYQGFMPWLEQMMGKIAPADIEKLRTAASAQAGEAINWIAKFLQKILTGGFAIFDILTLLIITPLVALYVMRDWDYLTTFIDNALPRRHYAVIKDQLHRIDRTLAGFVRGQGMVCIILGSYYALGLSLFVGLNFGASIGIIAGLLSFVPFVGTTFGWATSLLIGAGQFGDLEHAFMIIGVFAVGQFAESYFITPKLVGDRVGLHPVWILFGLFAGGSLLGFLGVLIAVPVTAVIGVLARFLMQQYRTSRYYQDAAQDVTAA